MIDVLEKKHKTYVETVNKHSDFYKNNTIKLLRTIKNL